MTNIFPDMVLESSTTEGTGDYALDGAPAGSGFRRFIDAAASGDPAGYIAKNDSGSIWEINLGIVTAGTPNTLSRGFLASSTGSAINWGPGTRRLYPYPIGLILGALLQGHIGTARPVWLQAGGQWIDSSASPWKQYQYDGSDNILLREIDPTNNATDLFAATLTLSAAAPLLDMTETDAAADGGRYRWVADNGRMELRSLDDAGATLSTTLQLWHSGGAALAGATGGDPGAGGINATDYQRNGTALPFQKAYESGNHTITSGGGPLNSAHGLGVQPKLYMGFLKCVSSEHGYSTGDEVALMTNQGSDKGVSLVPDATNISIFYGSAAGVFNVISKASGTAVSATNANWRLIVRAWA